MRHNGACVVCGSPYTKLIYLWTHLLQVKRCRTTKTIWALSNCFGLSKPWSAKVVYFCYFFGYALCTHASLSASQGPCSSRRPGQKCACCRTCLFKPEYPNVLPGCHCEGFFKSSWMFDCMACSELFPFPRLYYRSVLILVSLWFSVRVSG